jgi:nucleotide-binding universal stress UspA family protein
MGIKPIVVGADGSEQSLRAVGWAAREAVRRDVPLRIVSVLTLKKRTGSLTPAETPAGTTCTAAGKILADAADRAAMAAHRLTIDTSLLTGYPGLVLAGLTGQASMIVVGSRSAGGRPAITTGAVRGYLATHASCPVVIGGDETAIVHHQIIVGIRDPGACEAPLGFAFEEASLRAARLVAVQAWYWFRPAGTQRGVMDSGQISADALTRLFLLLESWREKYPDVEVGEEILHARAGRALADASSAADLLVLGRQGGRGNLDSPAGPVTRAVLHYAHGPVAIVG